MVPCRDRAGVRGKQQPRKGYSVGLAITERKGVLASRLHRFYILQGLLDTNLYVCVRPCF